MPHWIIWSVAARTFDICIWPLLTGLWWKCRWCNADDAEVSFNGAGCLIVYNVYGYGHDTCSLGCLTVWYKTCLMKECGQVISEMSWYYCKHIEKLY